MSDNKEVSKLYVDEQVVRLIAAQVAIIAGLSLAFNWIFPIFLLAADFGLRAFTLQPSPLAAVARIIADLLKLKTKPIFAAPKKFAAAVGFLFALAILVLLLLNYLSATYILGGVLIFFAVLESVFKICFGCYVYDWLVAPITNKRKFKKEIK
jgi:hypothetical protein